MKKLIGLFLCALFAYYFFHKAANPFLSFDESMKKGNSFFEKNYGGKKGKQWQIAKKLYEKHLSSKPSLEPRIPKMIHQIWIGGPIPEKYGPLQKSWQERHPDWVYRLWTDADLPTFAFRNRERFEKAVNIGERADIFRYEILNQFGGVYVDTDFECIRPLDPLNHLCDFYTGILGAYENDQEVCIANGLIGAVPNHPIIQYCLDMIAEKPAGKTADEVQAISGPGCFRRAFYKCYNKGNFRNVAFPFTFFYPIAWFERCGHLDEWAKARVIEPETFGIHYWDVSWANQEFAR